MRSAQQPKRAILVSGATTWFHGSSKTRIIYYMIYSIHVCIYLYMYATPPNVDHFVGVNAICGVLCLFCALGKAAEKGALFKSI